jgi:tRNA(Ile)-lysidine synthase
VSVLERVRSGGLLEPGGSTVVLLSGGRDSISLLDLAVRIAGADHVTALHVNYGLRQAADGDADHCAQLCGRLGVPLDVRRPRRPASGNLQAWARAERYGAGTQLALDRSAVLAAGHTATDQVETILYRLASSPSRRALYGMREREGLLVRPLLWFTREQTAAYCSSRGLAWREDETNDSEMFARGRVRARVLPALRTIHPATEQNILALARILRAEGDVLDELVDDALGGQDQISLARLRELAPALRRLVVQRLADQAAGAPAPGAARRADEVASLADTGTAALDLPHGVRATARGGVLTFGRTPQLPPRRP